MFLIIINPDVCNFFWVRNSCDQAFIFRVAVGEGEKLKA